MGMCKMSVIQVPCGIYSALIAKKTYFTQQPLIAVVTGLVLNKRNNI